ncbi:MAG: hypothetical protein ABIA21_01320 [Candidatus Aenigmatarchaeota archaeon]
MIESIMNPSQWLISKVIKTIPVPPHQGTVDFYRKNVWVLEYINEHGNLSDNAKSIFLRSCEKHRIIPYSRMAYEYDNGLLTIVRYPLTGKEKEQDPELRYYKELAGKSPPLCKETNHMRIVIKSPEDLETLKRNLSSFQRTHQIRRTELDYTDCFTSTVLTVETLGRSKPGQGNYISLDAENCGKEDEEKLTSWFTELKTEYEKLPSRKRNLYHITHTLFSRSQLTHKKTIE